MEVNFIGNLGLSSDLGFRTSNGPMEDVCVCFFVVLFLVVVFVQYSINYHPFFQRVEKG